MDVENNVCVMFIGDTGSGKSSLGNLYLKDTIFDTSQKPCACTLVPKQQTKLVNGMERIVIDTEGFDDGDHITEEQIQRLAQYLKSFPIGINAIGIVIQAQLLRLTKGVKDVVKFIYDAFGDVILSHLCVFWTFCSKEFPDRDIKEKEYKPMLEKYLQSISGAKTVPNIPFYYVNTQTPDVEFCVQSMTLFHGWAVSRQKFSSSEIKDATFGYSTEEEKEERVKVDTFTEGKITYEKYIDRARLKIIPNGNKNDFHYTDWETVKEYNEKIEEVTEETQNNVLSGYVNENGNKYEIRHDLVREVKFNFKTNERKEGNWSIKNENKILVGETKTHEELTEKSWIEITEGGYNQIAASFKRIVKINPDGDASFGEYEEIPGTRRVHFVKNEPVVIKKKSGGLLNSLIGYAVGKFLL
ncbi:hypothetical protein TVAG_343660 [Trichomonas vaginalis G3]|uniref:AIG1-type G domain-containing protein n=1 Tax=Trichomonas vaginalis (strain ATCC PRA-98 / G3) TaxID=412133 RepID=A2E1H0_TRIV3|nr:GTPase, IMAP family member-related family [Trichomonas vaginalis G3]EAY13537.1 hypothetical protein TVAG_343660 [Trichomonas vaginalis G3]KAI5529187.1 GTPase, IMAP family member-related family [Trichomonas vaginalis G3]|eukprot:XP_001325760.1 hypothetical protein [Trichomonas vaginalis G3]